ncbi:Regulatory-associated protein of mTOR [Blattella germanica]|nr:Regulatory-associated protein of mTOR [Blattella germanica]
MAVVLVNNNHTVEEDDSSIDWQLPISFVKKRHIEKIEGANAITQTWRMKERMKTVSVALVLCLNVGVDPPDIKQYERWQPRARYKQSLDPTVEEVKKLCTSLRRNAKEERVLFHYNGHGVPKPTANGEVWVFNRFADQHEKEYEVASQNRGPVNSAPTFKNCIQLAACAANQILPMNPDLPADIFTSCLTTPIKIALRWFVMQSTSKLVPKISMDLIDKIPGQLNDRRTMLGELNWIFTAITDTIAWNTLPRDLFQKLFRQDLLVASLFRNFLLAERIMRSYDCTPVSSPKLPPTYQHPMWLAWDLALDLCLAQLPAILESEDQFVHSPFFEEQLTAFQVWLTLGSEQRNPPEQLPIVLQVLLSQVHRLRALELLGKFLDLGPWAVNLALSVGIFPYVLKLLQSNARELRPLLVFIWAKILAVDSTCQADLVRDNGHKYFLSVLQDPSMHVRAAAVYALGTFVSSVTERTDHANNIDHSIAMTLINTCSHDMSPLVRKELVVALQWMVLLFENSFLSVAIQQETRTPQLAALADISMSPIMGMRRIASRDRLKMLSSGGGALFNPDGSIVPVSVGNPDIFQTNADKIKRVSSSSSISSLGHGQLSSLPSLSYGSIYMKLWHGLTTLDLDPHPNVRHMSHTVTNYIRDQVKDSSIPKEVNDTKISSSLSLPPSPSGRPTFLAGESPPTTSSTTELHQLSASRSSHISRTRKIVPNTISEEENDVNNSRKPLITTQFVDWSSKYFAQPVVKYLEDNDVESNLHYERSKASRITSLEFVNSHDVSLLLVGSDDGSIRLWNNYALTQQGREPGLITAWQALADVQPVSRSLNAGAGLVMSWEQRSQNVVVTGDVRIIRIWDAESELKVQDIPTGADCCVTSISTDLAESCLMLVGCGDGSVRLFDRRLTPQEARVMTWREHSGWVVDVNLRCDSLTGGKAVSGWCY